VWYSKVSESKNHIFNKFCKSKTFQGSYFKSWNKQKCVLQFVAHWLKNKFLRHSVGIFSAGSYTIDNIVCLLCQSLYKRKNLSDNWYNQKTCLENTVKTYSYVFRPLMPLIVKFIQTTENWTSATFWPLLN
jgi:hypothetical protein